MLSVANAMNAVSATAIAADTNRANWTPPRDGAPVALPQGRDAQQFFHSKLFELLKGDSQRLKSLATEMYARGWSTRDIEAAFTDENGVCLLSRSGVSEVSEALWEEYEGVPTTGLE